LAQKHPYPAAIEDVCRAAMWVQRHARAYGADSKRLVLAGESAGGNLVAALAVAASFDRPEPYAAAVRQAGVRPVAVVPACGLLQASDAGRFGRMFAKLPPWVDDYTRFVGDSYVGRAAQPGLADPLRILESDDCPASALPPFFAFAGTADPLKDDTRRLGQALARRGVQHQARLYEGGIHAFHVLIWQAIAKQAWRDQFAFLDPIAQPRTHQVANSS